MCSLSVWCMYVHAGLCEELYVHVCMCVVYVCGAHICLQVCVRDHRFTWALWRGQRLMSGILLFWTPPYFLRQGFSLNPPGRLVRSRGIFLHPLPSTDYRHMSSTAPCLVFLWVLAIWTQVLTLAQCTLQPPSHFRALMLSLLVDFLEHLFVPWWDSLPALGFIWLICKMRSSWNLCPQLLIYSNHPEGSSFSAEKLAQRVLSFLQDWSP